VDKFGANFKAWCAVSTLRLLVAEISKILSTYFSGYLIIESEPLNEVYVRLIRRAQELAASYKEVQTALQNFVDVFPNLYEAIGHPDSPDEVWDFSQNVIQELRARVSELYARTIPLELELPEDAFSISGFVLYEDKLLLKKALEVREKYVSAKRRREHSFVERAKAAAEHWRGKLELTSSRIQKTLVDSDKDLQDVAHAYCVDSLVRRLQKQGYEVRVEGTYNWYGERGSVDVYELHKDDESFYLTIYEVWTVIQNLNYTLRKLDEKARAFPSSVAKQRNETPDIVKAYLVLLATKQNCDLVLRHLATFRSKFEPGVEKSDTTTIFLKLGFFDPVQDEFIEILPELAQQSRDLRQEMHKWARFPTVSSFVEAWKRKNQN
jgi:hypothetical protein